MENLLGLCDSLQTTECAVYAIRRKLPTKGPVARLVAGELVRSMRFVANYRFGLCDSSQTTDEASSRQPSCRRTRSVYAIRRKLPTKRPVASLVAGELVRSMRFVANYRRSVQSLVQLPENLLGLCDSSQTTECAVYAISRNCRRNALSPVKSLTERTRRAATGRHRKPRRRRYSSVVTKKPRIV